MNSIWIPSGMQVLTNGKSIIEVEGNNIRQVIGALEECYPGIADYLVDGDMLTPGIAVVVNGEVSNLGLYTVIEPNSEIQLIPAIEGG